MKGFVPTPAHLVDVMVAKLFRGRKPTAADLLLDPGCGTGAFLEGVIRWCEKEGSALPRLVGVESDPVLFNSATARLGNRDSLQLKNEDFLSSSSGQFDFIIGNPPYVPITGLNREERESYRSQFRTARGRFDLYLLFFEQALRLLKPRGRLVFVTPEKFLYVQTAEPLRRILVERELEEIELIDEAAFGALVTYPTITTVVGAAPRGETLIRFRNGTLQKSHIRTGASWLPLLHGQSPGGSAATLEQAFVRISCGVATGADSVYVINEAELPSALRPFAFPTLSGRQIQFGNRIEISQFMLIPYALSGKLLTEPELGPLGEYLRQPLNISRLLQRTCTQRKPWYAFHENPPLKEILQPKILCKDIGSKPWFIVDEAGDIVPRHSVYYLVPKDSSRIHDLCAYLNSAFASEWLMANCQRAANGFVRLQSHVLKLMPLPAQFLDIPELAIA